MKFLLVLFLVLLTLKLCNVIAWTWFFVMLPLFVVLGGYAVIYVCIIWLFNKGLSRRI